MIYEFKFPDVGEGVHEGKILQLKFNSGDKVEAGDILAIIETDKVVAEIPTSKSGTLQKYGAHEGQIIEVGQTLAFIEMGGESSEEKKTAPIAKTEEDNAGVVGQLESASSFILPPTGEGFSDKSAESISLTGRPPKFLATPLARKIAQDKKIDLSKIKGTGPAGRITRDDVLKSIQSETPQRELVQKQEKISGGQEIIKLSTLRKTISKNMEASHAIPTATLHELACIDSLKELRELLNKGRAERLSYLPFFIKIISLGLKKFPQFNAHYDPQQFEIHRFNEINIGIAVETEKGLMVPVLKNVEKKNIFEIDHDLKNLVAKAKAGTITLEDLRGGTFSLTNYGSFGGLYGNPLILPPQVAILGIGRIHEAPFIKNAQMVAATMLPLSLVFDHRVIDGAPAGNFATYLRTLLSEPTRLIAEMN